MPIYDPALGKRLLAVLIGIVGGLALIFAAYYFVTGPRRAHAEAKQATATAVSATASKAAAQDALKIIVEQQAAHGRIDIVTQGNRDAILASDGAAEALGPAVHNAGLNALCLRDTYRLQPACVGLLHADPQHPAD